MRYTVWVDQQLLKCNKGTPKPLLHDVSGSFQPGTMTALMGERRRIGLHAHLCQGMHLSTRRGTAVMPMHAPDHTSRHCT